MRIYATVGLVALVLIAAGSLTEAGQAKAKTEKGKAEMKADMAETKGQVKALGEEAKGNHVKADVERAKCNVKGAGERGKGKMKETKAKSE